MNKLLTFTLFSAFLLVAAAAPAQQVDPKNQVDPKKQVNPDDLKKLQEKKGPVSPFDLEQLKKTIADLTAKGGPLDIEQFKKMIDDLTGKDGPLDIEKIKKSIEGLTAKGGPLDPDQVQKLLEKLSLSPGRSVSANNLHQIGLAMQLHADVMGGKFPAHAIFSKDGKTPLLSWRVALLKYLDDDGIYEQFKLDEPWDSPNNKKLIARMPKIYEPVGAAKKGEGLTYYQVFTGKGTLFDGANRKRLTEITDGPSNTVLVVEAREPVIWTKPDDLVLPRAEKMPELGGMFTTGMNVLFCDGSVRWLRQDIDPLTLRRLITPNDGEFVDIDKLEPAGTAEAELKKLLDKLAASFGPKKVKDEKMEFKKVDKEFKKDLDFKKDFDNQKDLGNPPLPRLRNGFVRVMGTMDTFGYFLDETLADLRPTYDFDVSWTLLKNWRSWRKNHMVA